MAGRAAAFSCFRSVMVRLESGVTGLFLRASAKDGSMLDVARISAVVEGGADGILKMAGRDSSENASRYLKCAPQLCRPRCSCARESTAGHEYGIDNVSLEEKHEVATSG